MIKNKNNSGNSHNIPGLPENIALALIGRELSAPKALLEKFPRIIEAMSRTWSKETEFKAVVEDLLFNDRVDERQGFEPEVLQDIFFMKELHDVVHGIHGDIDPMRVANHGIKEVSHNKNTSVTEKKTLDTPTINSKFFKEESDLIRVKARMEARRLGRTTLKQEKIGAILIEAGALDENKLELALLTQIRSEKKTPLGQILINMGLAKSVDVQRALCLQNGLELLDLDHLAFDGSAAKILPREVELSKKIVTVCKAGSTVLVAMSAPTDYVELEWLGFVIGGPVQLAWASEAAIERRLAGVSKHFTNKQGRTTQESEQFNQLAKVVTKPLAERKAQELAIFELNKIGVLGAEDPTIAGMVGKMLADAKRIGASDIHIECGVKSERSLVRMRIDGELTHYAQYDKAAHEAVVSRVKIMADMDISERRRPQDGKLAGISELGEKIEARVSTIPTVGSMEAVTMRILSAAEPVDLDKIGFEPEQLSNAKRLLESPHGLILVCGPTGSGKTTTLHSMIAKINTPEKKIWTVEDPVEIVQEGIVQTQALPKIGYSFDTALRSLMRADPDVIMVGEIRDKETASTALEASLTGHLVLSTLHTNSACETATRMVDLGVDVFALSDSLRGIVAQRLVKKLCHCCKARDISPSEIDDIARESYIAMGNTRSSRSDRNRWLSEIVKMIGGDLQVMEPVGCDECRGTGYRGRIGVQEILIPSLTFKRALCNKESANELLKIALVEGFKPLKARAIELACMGQTTMSEARSVGL